jgi:cytochrome b involved in lipid metabolism
MSAILELIQRSPVGVAAIVLVIVIVLFKQLFSGSAKSGPVTLQVEKKKKKLLPGYTAQQVAKHNTKSDLWVIVDGNVYDVSSFVDEHPGGVNAIMRHGGGDSSAGFHGPQHPSRVYDLLPKFQIGVLVRDYTAEEVSKHATEDDCFIIVKGKVYDVSSWIDDHPGGKSILSYAGKEASAAFFGSQHPNSVHGMLDKYFIGNLKA